MQKIIFYLTIILTASACISKYEAVLPAGEKRLVVNSYITNDSSQSAYAVQISQAISALESNYPMPDTTGAVVFLVTITDCEAVQLFEGVVTVTI